MTSTEDYAEMVRRVRAATETPAMRQQMADLRDMIQRVHASIPDLTRLKAYPALPKLTVNVPPLPSLKVSYPALEQARASAQSIRVNLAGLDKLVEQHRAFLAALPDLRVLPAGLGVETRERLVRLEMELRTRSSDEDDDSLPGLLAAVEAAGASLDLLSDDAAQVEDLAGEIEQNTRDLPSPVADLTKWLLISLAGITLDRAVPERDELIQLAVALYVTIVALVQR